MKKLLVLALLIVTTAGLMGCGDSKPTVPASKPAPATPPAPPAK